MGILLAFEQRFGEIETLRLDAWGKVLRVRCRATGEERLVRRLSPNCRHMPLAIAALRAEVDYATRLNAPEWPKTDLVKLAGRECILTYDGAGGARLDRLLDRLEEAGLTLTPSGALALAEDVLVAAIAVQQTRPPTARGRRDWGHGEITPSNLIVGPAGSARLINATLAVAGIRESHPPELAAAWCPPECVGNERATSSAADTYAIGALLATAVLGPSAVLGSADTLQETLRKAYGSGRLDVDEHFFDVVVEALATDPNRRFGNPAVMQAALREVGSAAESRLDVAAVAAASEDPAALAAIATSRPEVLTRAAAGTAQRRSTGAPPPPYRQPAPSLSTDFAAPAAEGPDHTEVDADAFDDIDPTAFDDGPDTGRQTAIEDDFPATAPVASYIPSRVNPLNDAWAAFEESNDETAVGDGAGFAPPELANPRQPGPSAPPRDSRLGGAPPPPVGPSAPSRGPRRSDAPPPPVGRGGFADGLTLPETPCEDDPSGRAGGPAGDPPEYDTVDADADSEAAAFLDALPGFAAAANGGRGGPNDAVEPPDDATVDADAEDNPLGLADGPPGHDVVDPKDDGTLVGVVENPPEPGELPQGGDGRAFGSAPPGFALNGAGASGIPVIPGAPADAAGPGFGPEAADRGSFEFAGPLAVFESDGASDAIDRRPAGPSLHDDAETTPAEPALSRVAADATALAPFPYEPRPSAGASLRIDEAETPAEATMLPATPATTIERASSEPSDWALPQPGSMPGSVVPKAIYRVAVIGLVAAVLGLGVTVGLRGTAPLNPAGSAVGSPPSEAESLRKVVGRPLGRAQLLVEVKPTGRVIVDGVTWGPPPVLIDPIEPGEHIVRAERDGCPVEVRKVTVAKGRRTIVRINLETE